MPLLPREVLGKLRENLREYGLRETLERSALWTMERLLASTLHRYRRVPLSAFAEAAASMHLSAQEVVESYLLSENRESELSQMRSEYQTLCVQIAERYRQQRVVYPQHYGVEEGSAFLLYAIVRCRRPSVVVETGVANGHSSFFILSAMCANGHGILHSVDRSAEVGSLLADEQRQSWRLHVLREANLKRSFREVLASLPPLDMFVHDSDHHYSWMWFELQAALKALAPGGIVVSDDCDGCFAFLDACQCFDARPIILVDTRKIFGLIFTQPKSGSARNANGQGSMAQRSHLVRV